MEPSNLTAKLALQLIIQKNTKQIYHTRLSLLLQFFGDKTEALVGGLKCLDITDTVGSMVDKILKEMPSFTTYSKCQNNFCPVPHLQHNSAKLSLNVYNEKVCVQTEVEKYIKNTKALCAYCGNERHSVIKTTSHIIVELNSIPKSNINIISTNKKFKTYINFFQWLCFRFREFNKHDRHRKCSTRLDTSKFCKII